ncbi:MAG: hypothetical protein IKH57_06885 [Clostridia bacterium]|nr:hypothetical protein [Clostridia bacterium]
MKKLMLVSLTLALMLVVSCCLAESIFAPLEETPTTAPSLTAPSYGTLANVAEDQVEQNAEGGTIVTYRGVDASGYNSFGTYLGGLGYSVASQEKREGQIAYALTDGQVEFVMIYDQLNQIMTLIYPKGTDYEQSAFPGFSSTDVGNEIIIPGLGKFVFQNMMMDESGVVCGFACVYNNGKATYFNEKGDYYHRNVKSWISFTYYNTSTSAKTFSQMGNDLFDAVLVYQNTDNEYRFEMKECGRYLESKKIISTAPDRSPDKYTLIENPPCDPLSTLDGAVVFDLPDGLRISADGTIVLELSFKTGEKYVICYRMDGENLGITVPQ